MEKPPPIMTPDEQLDVTLHAAEVLDAMNVSYLIGGSLASSVHGVIRTTNDADIVADLALWHVEPAAKSRSDSGMTCSGY